MDMCRNLNPNIIKLVRLIVRSISNMFIVHIQENKHPLGHCSLIFRFSDSADPNFCQNGKKIKLKIEKKYFF